MTYNQLDYHVRDGLCFYYKESPGSNVLLCSFHGSIRAKPENGNPTKLPVFRMGNLDIPNQPHLLCFSDLLLDIYKEDALELGWFLDTEKIRQQALIRQIVLEYAEAANAHNIIFYGSSGGGFPSLLMAASLGQTAIISNSQFFLEKHAQYKDLKSIIDKNDDTLQCHDIFKCLEGLRGPKRILNYCNIDDYTYKHHKPVMDLIARKFPDTIVESYYFSGREMARQKGVRNHRIQFPEGKTATTVINQHISELQRQISTEPIIAGSLLDRVRIAQDHFSLIRDLSSCHSSFFAPFTLKNDLGQKILSHYKNLLGNSDSAKGVADEALNGTISIKRFEPVTLKGEGEAYWQANPFHNRTWQWAHHYWAGLMPLITTAYMTKEQRYIDKLKRLIRSWAELAFEQPDSQEMLWHDHTTALRLEKLLMIHVCLDHKFEPAFRDLLRKVIVFHVAMLAHEKFYSKHTNHGYCQALAMYQASHPAIIEGLEDFNRIAYTRLMDEISFGFSSEGVHKENSPAYNLGMINNILSAKNILTVLPYIGDVQCFKFIDELVNKALYFSACIAQPDGRVPILGDSASLHLSRNLEHLDTLRHYKHYEFAAFMGCKGERPEAFNIFKESGDVTYRKPVPEFQDNPKQDFHLVFKCGLLSPYHRHDDDLNILLYAYGEHWLIDSGMYNYQEKDPVRLYMRSMMAHNIPIIQGLRPLRNPARVDPAWGIQEAGSTKEGVYFSGETGMYKIARAKRRIDIMENNSIRIYDTISPKTELPNTPIWLFHIPADKKIKPFEQGLNLQGQKMSLNLITPNDPNPNFKILKGHHEKFPGLVSYNFNKVEDSYLIRYIPNDDVLKEGGNFNAEFRLWFN